MMLGGARPLLVPLSPPLDQHNHNFRRKKLCFFRYLLRNFGVFTNTQEYLLGSSFPQKINILGTSLDQHPLRPLFHTHSHVWPRNFSCSFFFIENNYYCYRVLEFYSCEILCLSINVFITLQSEEALVVRTMFMAKAWATYSCSSWQAYNSL